MHLCVVYAHVCKAACLLILCANRAQSYGVEASVCQWSCTLPLHAVLLYAVKASMYCEKINTPQAACSLHACTTCTPTLLASSLIGLVIYKDISGALWPAIT